MEQESTSSLEQWVRGILDEADKLTIGTVLRLAEVRRELKLLTAERDEARRELQAAENKCQGLINHLNEAERKTMELRKQLEQEKEANRNQRGDI